MIISIIYNENDRNYETSYKGVKAGRRKFFSGNIEDDFINACTYGRKHGIVLLSSTCDHVVNDIDGLRWHEYDGGQCLVYESKMTEDDMNCERCNIDLAEIGIDCVLENDDWKLISPEEENLCPNCIAKRASKLKGVIIIRMKLVHVGEYK